MCVPWKVLTYNKYFPDFLSVLSCLDKIVQDRYSKNSFTDKKLLLDVTFQMPVSHITIYIDDSFTGNCSDCITFLYVCF